MTTETPPDWVLLEAAKRFGLPDEASDTLLHITYVNRAGFRALCDMIQQHEAFKQEVSDAVEVITNTAVDPVVWRKWVSDRLSVFIITKPDPLVEVLDNICIATEAYPATEYARRIREELEARGLEIREKKP
jgi:hypothetical protein